MNLKLKLLFGAIYLICFFTLIFIFLHNFDFKDLVDLNFFKNNQQILNNFKLKNTFLLLIYFSIFSIIWIFFLGFASPLILLSGFIFGKWLGTLIAVISFSIGCTLLYWSANFFFKEFIKEFIRKKLSIKVEKFINLFNKNDFLYFMLFRFTGGGMPFALQNVLPVIFSMKIKNYFFATLLGIIPSVFLVASLGAGVGNFINKSNSISWIGLIKDPEIYFPILIFILLLILASLINKFLFNKQSTK